MTTDSLIISDRLITVWSNSFSEDIYESWSVEYEMYFCDVLIIYLDVRFVRKN